MNEIEGTHELWEASGSIARFELAFIMLLVGTSETVRKRIKLPLDGAIPGVYFGGNQGTQLGFCHGSMVGSAVDPKSADSKGQ